MPQPNRFAFPNWAITQRPGRNMFYGIQEVVKHSSAGYYQYLISAVKGMAPSDVLHLSS